MGERPARLTHCQVVATCNGTPYAGIRGRVIPVPGGVREGDLTPRFRMKIPFAIFIRHACGPTGHRVIFAIAPEAQLPAYTSCIREERYPALSKTAGRRRGPGGQQILLNRTRATSSRRQCSGRT